MRYLPMLLLLLPLVASAESRWLHFNVADQTKFRKVEGIFDEVFGSQRPYIYGGISKEDADYIFHDTETDTVIRLLRENEIDQFEIRRPTKKLKDWFPKASFPNDVAEPPSDEVLIGEAYGILGAMDRLVNTVEINKEFGRATNIADGASLAKAAISLGQEIIEYLGGARRPALDDFLLTNSHSFNWASLPMIERDNHLLDHYIRRITENIRSNRQTMMEYVHGSPQYVGKSSMNHGLSFDSLGITMNRAASDLGFERPVDHILKRGFGAALLRLATEGTEEARQKLTETIRAWYAPIATHISARNEAERFMRFGVGLDIDFNMRAWENLRSGWPLPEGIINELARARGQNPADTAVELRSRWEQSDHILSIDGDFVFKNTMQQIALGGDLLREARPSDEAARVRYYIAVSALFYDLINVDPPINPGTKLALLEGASLVENRIRRSIHPTLARSSGLMSQAHDLRREVLTQLANFDYDGCKAQLQLRGLAPALRRSQTRSVQARVAESP